MQDFEEGLLFAFAEFQQQPLVDNQQIRQAHEFRVVELATSFVPEGAGHVGLAAARGPGDEDVAAFANELARCKSCNQIAVQFPARRIVDFVDVGSFLFESGMWTANVLHFPLQLSSFACDAILFPSSNISTTESVSRTSTFLPMKPNGTE